MKDENKWPRENAQVSAIPEMRKNTCLTTTSQEPGILDKYSSYSKLCRIIAYCLRLRPTNTYHGTLRVEEIREAEVRILRLLQATRFADEIKGLKDGRTIAKGKLANLNPFLDENELLRVGGRLQN